MLSYNNPLYKQFRSFPVLSTSHGRVSWVWQLRTPLNHKWSWWLLVPWPIQKWWVHHENVRQCSIIGHDDTLFHLAREGIVPPNASDCSDCMAPVLACTGSGWTHKVGKQW